MTSEATLSNERLQQWESIRLAAERAIEDLAFKRAEGLRRATEAHRAEKAREAEAADARDQAAAAEAISRSEEERAEALQAELVEELSLLDAADAAEGGLELESSGTAAADPHIEPSAYASVESATRRAATKAEIQDRISEAEYGPIDELVDH